MRSSIAAVVVVLGLTSVAGAQDAEGAYADALGAALGREVKLLQRLNAPRRVGGDGLRALRGVRVDLGDVVVRRMKLADADSARRVALGEGCALEAPVVGEVRGGQVLLVSGEPVRDGAFARRALDAGWVGLPAPAPVSEAIFADLGDRDSVLLTTAADGPLAERVRDDLAAARRHTSGESGVVTQDLGPGDAHVAFTDERATTSRGLTARVHVDPRAAWTCSAGAPERFPGMAAYFLALTGRPVGDDFLTALLGVFDWFGLDGLTPAPVGGRARVGLEDALTGALQAGRSPGH